MNGACVTRGHDDEKDELEPGRMNENKGESVAGDERRHPKLKKPKALFLFKVVASLAAWQLN